MITKGMPYTKELGLYAIIDWHVLAYNPHEDKEEAKKFFEKYAGMYSGYDNVIYEICNEPTGTPWYDGTGRDLYSYANELIPIIREKDPDALIVVGTNTWSQDVDDVHNKPIEGYDNIMYAFHFYSGSHKGEFRDRVKNALDSGTPVFITEFGICDASGNGNIQTGEADLWMEFCEKYNISHACWAISKKDESASYFKTDCVRTSGWKQEDLAPTGVWLFNTYRREASSEQDDTAEKTETTEEMETTKETDSSKMSDMTEEKSALDQPGTSATTENKETTAPAEPAPGFFERIIEFFRNLFAGVSAPGVAS
jgi:endoglucanase